MALTSEYLSPRLPPEDTPMPFLGYWERSSHLPVEP